ncbi:hypothetical protein GCM10010207_09810 [Streptomyces atratus]|nr:hypothetical protein GCM10010207_09810 [Streptomyces atratus]
MLGSDDLRRLDAALPSSVVAGSRCPESFMHMNGRWAPGATRSAGRRRPDRTSHPVRENGQVSDVRHVLVLPDRDAAEEVAAELGDRFGVVEEPQLVRDALAGEDDAEDAQWLVVVEDPSGLLDSLALDAFAAEYEGWLEAP